jgi:hypothetical protein
MIRIVPPGSAEDYAHVIIVRYKHALSGGSFVGGVWTGRFEVTFQDLGKDFVTESGYLTRNGLTYSDLIRSADGGRSEGV